LICSSIFNVLSPYTVLCVDTVQSIAWARDQTLLEREKNINSLQVKDDSMS
jgi:hypothetical protein